MTITNELDSTCGISDEELTQRFKESIWIDDEVRRIKGLPVARYDRQSKRAYLEYPDGRREYVGEMSEKDGDIVMAIIKIITDNNHSSASEIAKRISVTQRTVERYIKELREEGKLLRHGSARGGYWEVKK